MRAKCNSIKRNFGHPNSECKIQLFNTHCNTFYGCELCDIMSNQLNHIFVNWRKSIRYLLDLPYRTHCYILPVVMNTPNANTKICQRIICFFKKGLQHCSEYVQSFYKHCIINHNSFMARNVNVICRRINISPHDLINKSISSLKKGLKETEQPMDWKCSMVKELLGLRNGSVNWILDKDDISFPLNYLCVE